MLTNMHQQARKKNPPVSAVRSLLAYCFWTTVGEFRRVRSLTLPRKVDPLDLTSAPQFKSIAVVGRSASAVLLEKYDDFALTILVNFTDSDLADANLKRRVLSSKNIVLLHNSIEKTVSHRTFQAMNVSAIVFLAFDPSSGTTRKRTTWRLNKHGRRVQYLPRDTTGRFSVSGGGAGIGGVALASSLSNDVHTFGIDFYQTDYLTESVGKISALTHGAKLKNVFGPKREKAFQLLAELSPEVSFTIHSTVDLEVSAPNVVSIFES